MKQMMYTVMAAALISSISASVSAQVWRPWNAGLPHGIQLKTVYGDGTRILASNTSGFSGHQMYYTPDSSTPFNYSPSTLGSVATAESHIVKCMNVLFVGNSSGIYKSNDNGVTWVQAGSSGANLLPTYAMYASNDTLYSSSIIGPNFSTDTGTTWTAIPGYTGSLVVSFNKTNGILYVGGTSSLQYTPDNGATWNNVTTPASISGASVADIAEIAGNVYAGTNNGVYQTTDNGHTWTRVLSQPMFSLTAIDTSLLGGTATSGIYHSDHTGTSWAQINTGLPFTGIATYDAVNSISYNDYFVIAATAGDSAIYVVGLADLGLHPAEPTLGIRTNVQNSHDCMVYPNPSGSETNIVISNYHGEKISAALVDVSGTVIKQTTVFAAHVKFDLEDVASGTYFVLIKTGNEQLSKKIVVIK